MASGKLTCEGYSNKFVENIDAFDFDCAFCCMVVRDAMQVSACGHLFCSTCWSDWMKINRSSKGKFHCPVDKKVIDPSQVFHDRKQDRLIRGLKVYCDNKDCGCDITPELRDLEAHLKKCEYQTVYCELECGVIVIKALMEDHKKNECPRRMVTCDACDSHLEHQNLQRHENECLLKLVGCKSCETPVPMQSMDDHMKKHCIKASTHCSFALLGCVDKVIREELKDHHSANTEKHLNLLNLALCRACRLDVPAPAPNCKPMESTDGHLELPVSLWGKIGVNPTVLNLATSQKPIDDKTVKFLKEKITKLESLNDKSKNRFEHLEKDIVTLRGRKMNPSKTLSERSHSCEAKSIRGEIEVNEKLKTEREELVDDLIGKITSIEEKNAQEREKSGRLLGINGNKMSIVWNKVNEMECCYKNESYRNKK